MKKIVDYFYVFSKISTSLILLLALLTLGYFFYLSYEEQEDVYLNQNNKDNSLQDSVNDNFDKIQEISKKIDSNDKSLIQIQKLIKNLNNNALQNNKNDDLELMLINLSTNLKNLSLDVKKLKDQIQNEKNIVKDNISNDSYLDNQKKDLIELIIIKFENNLSFDEELIYLEKITNKNKIHLFEKLNILLNKEYKGKQYTQKIFAEESNNYIKNKFNKDTNSIFRTVFFPYISISPSKQNNLEDQDLLSINNIEMLIKNKEYKKSLDKIKLINKHEIFYSGTSKQLEIAFSFNSLLKEIEN